LAERFSQRRVRWVALVAAMLLIGMFCAGAQADDKPTKSAKAIRIPLGQSQVVDTPWPVKRVAVADPKIANVEVLSPGQVLLQGTSAGATDIVMWSLDEKVHKARIEVDIDVVRLRRELAGLFPGTTLKVDRSGNMIILKGTLSRAQQSQQLHNFFQAKGIKLLDMTELGGVQQVMLHVRVAEVSRRSMRQLGVNYFDGGENFWMGQTVGTASGGALNPIVVGPPEGANAAGAIPFLFNADVGVSPSITLFGGLPKENFQFWIQALAENQYLRVLAEPTLVALSGKDASFLAGGEFPIPIVQGSSAGGGTSITVEYREFGVRLNFRPTVLGDGTIELYVAPEVSELSDVGAVEIEGFSIPSVTSRRAETTLQLRSQQTFAMAGLISRSATGRNSRLPWIGDVPVLGALFASKRFQTTETELIVLVTPSLVEPLNMSPAWPGINHIDPNDWELFALGRLEGQDELPVLKASKEDLRWLHGLGLHRLKGPGAWAEHHQVSAPSKASVLPDHPTMVVDLHSGDGVRDELTR
jgi:pilus assembly protein CpaC